MIININEYDASTYYLELHLLGGYINYLTETVVKMDIVNVY